LCVLVVVASCDCGEPLTELIPEIAVDPEVLELGAVQTRLVHERIVTVGNRGSGSLVVTGVALEPADGPFTIVSAPSSVGPRGSAPLVVSFTVDAPGPHAADLVLTSNDPATPRLVVPIRAEGGAPILFVTPNPLGFGRVNEGVGAAQTVTIANDGLHELTLTSVDLGGDVGFVLDAAAGLPLPRTLQPRESVAVVVALQPDAGLVARAGRDLRDDLVVGSDVGDVTVPVSASINLAPVVVNVEERSRRSVVKAAVGDIVRLDGSETADPEGDAFTLLWSVVERPSGSAMTVIGQGQERVRVTPDVVGRAVVRLRATDVHGAFAEADVELLPRDLAIVLRWAAADDAGCRAFSPEQCASFTEAERRQRCCGQSDLDLHFVAPGGVLGDFGSCPVDCDEAFCAEESDEHVDTCRQTGLDCAYANRTPEWGARGRADDPSLDIDDVSGDGPEVITLNEPGDGSYRVLVHYCRDRLGTEPSDATIEIVDEGEVLTTVGPQRIAAGQVWIAAVLLRANNRWQVVPSTLFEPNVPADLCGR
jgi:hypothetical protein